MTEVGKRILKRYSILWLTAQMFARATVGLGRSQEPGTPPGPLKYLSRSLLLPRRVSTKMDCAQRLKLSPGFLPKQRFNPTLP